MPHPKHSKGYRAGPFFKVFIAIVAIQFIVIGLLVADKSGLIAIADLGKWVKPESSKEQEREREQELAGKARKNFQNGNEFSFGSLALGEEEKAFTLENQEKLVPGRTDKGKSKQRSPSELLASKEIISLPDVLGKKAKSSDVLENIKVRLLPDSYLDLVDIKSEEFLNSQLRDMLRSVPKTRLYVLTEFSHPLNFDDLNKLKRLGFSGVYGVPVNQYVGKSLVVLYIDYKRLGKSVTILPSSVNFYLLKNYTADGYYKLNILSLEEAEDFQIDIKFPYSKWGRELVFKKNTVTGIDMFDEEPRIDKHGSSLVASLEENQIISFYSEFKYQVSLERELNRHIKVRAKKIGLGGYKEQMETEQPQILEEFTIFSKKIVPSSYIDSIISRVNTNLSVADIWNQVVNILDKEIAYDWRKRDLFFSGNLTYTNIEDMFLSSQELSEKRVGACTERTSLEIAILRRLGIAARAATRLYHIYTEVYIPEAGWTTTSLTLNEIPLTESSNKDMSYFVFWEPEHPVRLKWGGQIYPAIAYSY